MSFHRLSDWDISLLDESRIKSLPTREGFSLQGEAANSDQFFGPDKMITLFPMPWLTVKVISGDDWYAHHNTHWS